MKVPGWSEAEAVKASRRTLLRSGMGGGLAAVILAGCAGSPPPPVPDVPVSANYSNYSPPSPPGWASLGFADRMVLQNPELSAPEQVRLAQDHWRAAAQHDNGPSWGHDLATAGLAVGGVELARHALSGAKTGAAVATDEAAAGRLAAAPKTALVGEAGAASRVAAVGGEVAAAGEAEEIVIWLAEECVLVFCR